MHPDGTREPLAIGVPGDREVDQKRLEGQLEPIEVEPMDEAELAKHPALVKGYIGPEVLGEDSKSGIRYLVDPRVVEGTRWVTGANVAGSHVVDLVAGRDFTPDGTIEAADVRDGDACPNCTEGTLESARGIEMGHIFQLGRKYADALGLKVLDENGKLVTVTMGSYGIGPSRAVAAIAEGTLDDIGLCWPRNVAPADVHVVAAGKDDAIFEAAEKLAADLTAQGVEVLLDDRRGKVSPGVKFKDAELIGVPTIVTVGRGLADGTVEVRDRRTGEREEVAVDAAAARVVEAVRGPDGVVRAERSTVVARAPRRDPPRRRPRRGRLVGHRVARRRAEPRRGRVPRACRLRGVRPGPAPGRRRGGSRRPMGRGRRGLWHHAAPAGAVVAAGRPPRPRPSRRGAGARSLAPGTSPRSVVCPARVSRRWPRPWPATPARPSARSSRSGWATAPGPTRGSGARPRAARCASPTSSSARSPTW